MEQHTDFCCRHCSGRTIVETREGFITTHFSLLDLWNEPVISHRETNYGFIKSLSCKQCGREITKSDGSTFLDYEELADHLRNEGQIVK